MTTSSTPARRLTEAELARRWAAAYPEAMGPAEDHESGEPIYGQPHRARAGEIPPLLDPLLRDKENRERERQWDAMSDAEKAAIERMRELAHQQLRRGGGLL